MARGNQNELVQCPYCGEMYSITYKNCPFCNEDGTGSWDAPDFDIDEAENETYKGGKRLQRGGTPSIGSLIWWGVSLALILAAVGIVFSILHSARGEKKADNRPPVSPPPAVESVAPSTSVPPESPAPTESTAPVAESTAPVESLPPQPQETTPTVNTTTPTDFTLNRTDFTFDKAGEVFDMKVKFTPADATAEVQWKSSDPNIAAVSWNGRVTAVSKGTVTLTATVEGVGSKTCVCRCNFTSPASTQTSSSGTTTTTTSSSPNLKLNREDFTLSHEGETFRMVVSGTSSAVTWTSSNTSVASIGADGTVKAVGKGTCNVTATVDGKTLTCIVRCSW